MNIAVVDDEKVIMGQISGLVRKQMPDCYLESYATGEGLLEAAKRFDIVFLDIRTAHAFIFGIGESGLWGSGFSAFCLNF